MAAKFKSCPGNENWLPHVQMETSKADYQTVAIPWSHPKQCYWFLLQLQAKHCWWWGCGFAIWVQSHSQSSRCRLFGQLEVYKQPPSCKLVVVRMKCTSWMVVQGFRLWVGIFLSLWRVDGWVIIESFWVRIWVSIWWVVNCIIIPFIFMHERQYWEIKMLGLIIVMFHFGKGIVAAIGLHVWLSWNW